MAMNLKQPTYLNQNSAIIKKKNPASKYALEDEKQQKPFFKLMVPCIIIQC